MTWLRQRVYADRYLLLLIAVFAILSQIFPLRVQAVEPYTYAAGVDGYYNVATTFATAQPEVKLPDFSRYHPNHPLLHLAAGVLHDWTGIGGLQLFKAFNLIAALIALWLIYHLVMGLGLSRNTALLTSIAAGFTYIFWVGALSAEVHLPAVALQLLSARYLVKFLQGQPGSHRNLRFAALFFALATAFHLAALFCGFAFAAAVLMQKMQNRWRVLLECAIIYALIVLFVYGVLLVAVLRIESFTIYKATMLIYSHLLHIRYSGFEWVVTLFKSFAHALVFGFSVWSWALKIMWLGAILLGMVAIARAQRPIAQKVLLLTWPVAYIVSHAIFGARADSIHSWLFTLPALLVALAFLFERLLAGVEARIYLIAFVCLIGANNFIAGVLPNSLLKESDFQFAEDPQALLAGHGIEKPAARELPLLVLMKYPAVTFPDIWYLGSRLGYKNQTPLVYCCGKQGYQQILRSLMEKHDEFFLLTDEISDELPELFGQSKRDFRVLLEKRGEIARNSLVSSLYFERPAGYQNLKELRIFYATANPALSRSAPAR